MAKKFLCILAVVLLAVCLLSGGCNSADDEKMAQWKDLLKIPVDKDESLPEDNKMNADNQEEVVEVKETISVSLYFGNEKGSSLISENREIPKVEGIARSTIQELIKGPAKAEYLEVFPGDTRLLDINLKTDGMCIVDLSSEAGLAGSEQQAKLMVYAIANTLGQFPTVSSVSFMIEGEQVDSIAGYLDLSQPIEPDYNM